MSISDHITALETHLPEVMGPPLDPPSPWPVFDPETQERYPVTPEMIQCPHDPKEFAPEGLINVNPIVEIEDFSEDNLFDLPLEELLNIWGIDGVNGDATPSARGTTHSPHAGPATYTPPPAA